MNHLISVAVFVMFWVGFICGYNICKQENKTVGWWARHRVRRLLVKREGLKAIWDAYSGRGTPWQIARNLGEVNEKLRQLGHEEMK